MSPRGRAVALHPPLLLGRAQAHEHHVRFLFADVPNHRAVLLKISVAGPTDIQPRISFRQIRGRPLRHPGLRAQQVELQTGPRQPFHQRPGKVDAGHPAGQGPLQQLGRIDDADAVRQGQRRPRQRLGIGRVLLGHQHQLRVGGHHIRPRAVLCQRQRPVRRLVHGHIVKGHAHHVCLFHPMAVLSHFDIP